MKRHDYTPEEAARIERHVQTEFEEKQARLEHYRTARQERIASGTTDHGDLVSDEDVVCPHCGAWVEGQDPIDHAVVATYEVKCLSCQREYRIEVRVRRTYTTEKLEADE